MGTESPTLPYRTATPRQVRSSLLLIGVTAVLLGAIGFIADTGWTILVLPGTHSHATGPGAFLSNLQLVYHLDVAAKALSHALLLASGIALLCRNRITWCLTIAFLSAWLINPALDLAIAIDALGRINPLAIGLPLSTPAAVLYQTTSELILIVPVAFALYVLFQPAVKSRFNQVIAPPSSDKQREP